MIAACLLYFAAGFVAGTYGLYMFVRHVAREYAWKYLLNKEVSDDTHARCVDASRCPRCYYDIPELDFVGDPDEDIPVRTLTPEELAKIFGDSPLGKPPSP